MAGVPCGHSCRYSCFKKGVLLGFGVFGGQLVDGLPLGHGIFQRHTARNSIAAAGVDRLDLFHLFAGQAVALHGDECRGPGQHRDGAEQHNDHNVHARGVRVVLGG